MKKIFASKKFMSKIALILVCLILFQFIAPQPTRAATGEEIGGTLLKPIVSLFLTLSDGVASILQNTLFKKTDSYTEEITVYICNNCGARGEKNNIVHTKEDCTEKNVKILHRCSKCGAEGPTGEVVHTCGTGGLWSYDVKETKTVTKAVSVDAFEYIDLTGSLSTIAKRILVFLGGAVVVAIGIGLTAITGGFFATCLVAIGKVVLASGVVVAFTAFLPNVAEIWEAVFGDSFTYANILVTPEALFKNQIGLFDANFFRKANTTTDYDITSEVATTLRELISNVYSVVRNISIMAMLIVIVYIAIRMLMALSPREKSRYKEGFVNCIIGLIIILGMHYAMSISNTVIDNITNSIIMGDMGYTTEEIDENAKPDDTYDEETMKENITGASIKISGTNIYNAFVEDGKVKEAYENKVTIAEGEKETVVITANNFQEIARYKAQQIYETDSAGDNKTADWNYIGWAFVYVMLTILTLAFVWMYGKRLLYLAALTMFAPIVGVMYPINRADGSRAHTLNLWFKEYFGNLIIQPFHMFLYVVVIGGAMATAIINPIYVIIVLTGFIFMEKLLKDLLGIQDTRIGGIGKSLQDTNRAIKTATRETARVASAVGRGIKKGTRAAGEFAERAGRRAGDANSSEEDANTNVRYNSSTGNARQPVHPDGTDALEASNEEKRQQQRMTDGNKDEAEKRARYANMSDEELEQQLRADGIDEDKIPQKMSEMRQAYNEEEQKQEMLDSDNAGFDESTGIQLQSDDTIFDGTTEDNLDPVSTNELDDSGNLEIPSSTGLSDIEESMIDDGSQGINFKQNLESGTNITDIFTPETLEAAEIHKTKSGQEYLVADTPMGKMPYIGNRNSNTRPTGTMAKAVGDEISIDSGNSSIRTMGASSTSSSTSSRNSGSSINRNLEIDNIPSGGASVHGTSTGNVNVSSYGNSNISTEGQSGEIMNFKEILAQREQTQRSTNQTKTESANTQNTETGTSTSGRTVPDVSTSRNNNSGTSNRQTSSGAQNNNIDEATMQQIDQELVEASKEKNAKKERIKEKIMEELKETAKKTPEVITTGTEKTTGIAGRVLGGVINAASDAMAGNPAGVVQDAMGVVKGSAAEIRADRGRANGVRGMAQLNNEAQYLVKEGHTEERAKYVEALCGKLKDKGIVIDDRRDMEAVARAIKATGDKGDKTINSLIGTAKQFKINGKSREDYERAVESKGVSSSAKDALLKLFDNLKA